MFIPELRIWITSRLLTTLYTVVWSRLHQGCNVLLTIYVLSLWDLLWLKRHRTISLKTINHSSPGIWEIRWSACLGSQKPTPSQSMNSLCLWPNVNLLAHWWNGVQKRPAPPSLIDCSRFAARFWHPVELPFPSARANTLPIPPPSPDTQFSLNPFVALALHWIARLLNSNSLPIKLKHNSATLIWRCWRYLLWRCLKEQFAG